MTTGGLAAADGGLPGPTRRRRLRRNWVLSIGCVSLLVAFVGGAIFVQSWLSQDRSHLTDTWTWDGQDWNQANSSQSPSWRWTAAYVYDEKANQIVLFGGQTGESGDAMLSADTWSWDGHWTLRQPTLSPPAREGAAAASDPIRGNVVLFGGQADVAGSQLLADTWTWDGQTWHLMATKQAPPAEIFDRSQLAAFDPKSGQVILVSQSDTTSRWTVDTWGWDGQTWTKLGSAEDLPTPAPLVGAPELPLNIFLYTDSQHGRVVMLGAGVPLSWDGSKWSPVGVSSAVLVRGGDFAYDAQTATVISFGGSTCTGFIGGGGDPSTAETWGWDGAAWRRLDPHTQPPLRSITYLAYDSRIQRVVMFGGYHAYSCFGNALF